MFEAEEFNFLSSFEHMYSSHPAYLNMFQYKGPKHCCVRTWDAWSSQGVLTVNLSPHADVDSLTAGTPDG